MQIAPRCAHIRSKPLHRVIGIGKIFFNAGYDGRQKRIIPRITRGITAGIIPRITLRIGIAGSRLARRIRRCHIPPPGVKDKTLI